MHVERQTPIAAYRWPSAPGRSQPVDSLCSRALPVPLVVVRLDAKNRQRDDDDGSLSAGRGQFCWRSWSVAEELVGRWFAFCTLPTTLYRWLCNEGWPLYAFNEIIK